MKRTFNTTGVCFSHLHYTVDTTAKLNIIEKMVNNGNYFTINRARQYGKTTTLWRLKDFLSEKYIVFLLSFEVLDEETMSSADSFCKTFMEMMLYAIKDFHLKGISPEIIDKWHKIVTSDSIQMNFFKLSRLISELCRHASKPVVLMIDEVDQSCSSDVFIKFLGVLRNDYQRRTTIPVFQSVILAGIYDIKNLKLKIRKDIEHQYNSPWNIAADFNLDMSFSISDIAGMLAEYETDWNTGMDAEKIAFLIYDYTQGYPFLVSRICKLLDEQTAGSDEFPDKTAAWTERGVIMAVKELLNESNTLFDDMVKKLAEFPELKQMIKEILFLGRSFPYNADNWMIDMGTRFGFIKNENKTVMITNRIFETRMYDMFLSEEMTGGDVYKANLTDKN